MGCMPFFRVAVLKDSADEDASIVANNDALNASAALLSLAGMVSPEKMKIRNVQHHSHYL